MAPLPATVLHRRGDNAGRTFSIIFAVIALLVVLACLIWGILLPKYRKRSIGRPGRVAANRAATSNRRQFPNHPALLRGFRHKSPIALRQYNPRTESPFPPNPAQSSVDHTNPPPARLLGAPTHSNGLFTPVKDRASSRRGGTRRYPRIFRPRASGEHEGQGIMSQVNAGQDYVLPIPEALVLKARPAGRPPPLSRQLGMFPLPQGTVSRKGGLVHAVKLFQDLERRDSKSTTDTLGTPCPTPCQAGGSNVGRSTVLQVAVRDESLTAQDGNHPRTMLTQPISPPHANPPPFRHDPNGRSVRALGSIVPAADGPEKQLSSGNTGTWTRPTTPASDVCVLRDCATTEAKTNSASFKRGYTPSTNPFTTPGLSSTPPTSSIVSNNTVPAPSTPIRVSRPGYDSCATASGVRRRQRTLSSTALAPPAKFATISYDLSDEAAHHTKQSVYPTHALTLRPRVARFNLVTSCDLQPEPAFMQRDSISSPSTIVKPIMTTELNNRCPRASSIYSRDTKGVSFAGIPGEAQTTPDTAEMIMHPWLSIADRIDSFQQNDDTMEVLKSKIDDWDLHTAHLDASVLPPYPLKRSISDFGPRSERMCSSPPSKNCKDAWKRDSNGRGRCIPARNICWTRALHAREAVQRERPAPTRAGVMGLGTAPGGGQWF